MGYSDTDVAEYLYKKKPRIDSLVNFLCNDLTEACSSKPPPVPKVTTVYHLGRFHVSNLNIINIVMGIFLMVHVSEYSLNFHFTIYESPIYITVTL